MRVNDQRKRRRVRLFQKYLVNPPSKLGVYLGLARRHVIVETTGCKTGKRRRTIVGVHEAGSVLWVVAEQGRHAGYVRNLESNPAVRVRLRGRWRIGTARVVDSDDPQTRLESFERGHAAIVRRVGTDLLSIRIDLAED